MPKTQRGRTPSGKSAKADAQSTDTVTGDAPNADQGEAIGAPEDIVAEEGVLVSDGDATSVPDPEPTADGDADPAPASGPGDDSAPVETPPPTAAPVASAAAADLPAPQPAQQPAPQNAAGGAGTASLVIGGVVAAAIGAAATLTFLPEGWQPADTSALERRIAAVEGASRGVDAAALDARISDALGSALAPLEARLSALEAADPAAGLARNLAALDERVAGLEAAEAPDLAPLQARIATLEATGLDAQALSAALAPLTTRIAQIEADITAQARAAVEVALAEARAAVEAQASALASREDDIEAAQARIAARAALAEMVAAAESGAAVPGALATLGATVAVPDALAPLAEGLITLGALQSDFAPAARAALASESPPPDAPISDRVMNFLRSQTGVRSLAPRDGDGTDAVLSRAEAALRQGNVAGALSELEALTGAPAAAMADWRAQAEARQAALAALEALQDQLLGNEG